MLYEVITSVNASTGVVTGISSGTATISYTVTNAYCSSSATTIVTVRPAFTAGAINTTGETICYGGNPSVIGSATAASGGDNSITYKWQANGVV